MKTIKEVENEFFSKLSETLEEQFPKHECKERGGAVVLSAFANICLKTSLLSLLSEVEKREIEQSTGGADRYEISYITMGKLLTILSELREGKESNNSLI